MLVSSRAARKKKRVALQGPSLRENDKHLSFFIRMERNHLETTSQKDIYSCEPWCLYIARLRLPLPLDFYK